VNHLFALVPSDRAKVESALNRSHPGPRNFRGDRAQGKPQMTESTRCARWLYPIQQEGGVLLDALFSGALCWWQGNASPIGLD
jgi:hypothetical protein